MATFVLKAAQRYQAQPRRRWRRRLERDVGQPTSLVHNNTAYNVSKGNPNNPEIFKPVLFLLNETKDDRVILDQQITDDQIAVFVLDDQFLLEEIEHIDASHALGR
jgi:hypothetical protein